MDLISRIEWLIDNAMRNIERPYSLRAAAQYLDCSKSFLYKMVSQKKITHSKPNGRRIYFSKLHLDEFALSKQIKANDK